MSIQSSQKFHEFKSTNFFLTRDVGLKDFVGNELNNKLLHLTKSEIKIKKKIPLKCFYTTVVLLSTGLDILTGMYRKQTFINF